MVVKSKKGGRVNSAKIKWLARRAGIEAPLRCTPGEVERSLWAAELEYAALVPRARELREEEQAEAWLVGSRMERRRLEQRIRGERAREVARAIRAAQGKRRMASVTEVEVEQDDGTRTVYRSKEEVEAVVQECLEQRFQLMESTDWMQPEWRDQLGLLGKREAAKIILQGGWEEDPTWDDRVLTLVRAMEYATSARTKGPLDMEITREDFQHCWTRARERTSSSLSGIHFGHYMATALDNDLSEIHALFLTIAVQMGYSLLRWQHGLTVLLEKIQGVRLVDKLRAILLLEADFNCINKMIVAVRMMRRARQEGEIPKEIMGGIQGRNSQEAGKVRALTLDLLRQKWKEGIMVSADAHTCYDRMQHLAVSICCQRLGVPLRAMVCMLSTLQAMRYYLRMGHGESSNYYGGPRLIPFQGGCQGNGAAPGFWIAISIVLVRYLTSRGHAEAHQFCHICLGGHVLGDLVRGRHGSTSRQ